MKISDYDRHYSGWIWMAELILSIFFFSSTMKNLHILKNIIFIIDYTYFIIHVYLYICKRNLLIFKYYRRI
ncbi:hypothetical protein C1645_562259 [Glomus cerebriforme]|uniref:Uncharacterized protein n=1 Tax=Glomus cerebriforme TaxID=658196 RepID=A0A397T9F0_9GLOM|nr:hypothetical protein C1645_562259 [Glomus cerebriforme]